MSLHLVFSWFADGGAWPEHPGEKAAVVDAAVVGPHGFLDHLETMLGLGAPAVAGVKRIATYLNKLKCAGAGNFWSRSFSADPWSTAREVLVWRDQLVEAGWGPEIAVATGRLGDLARAETSGPVLPAGFSDRLRQVIQVLATPRSLPLASVALIDARADLPAGWRRLLDRLEDCGVSVTSQTLACVRHESGDLSRLLAPFDDKGQRPEFAGDGGVILLTADTELVAAEALAAWLAADKSGNEGLVFILGKDSDLLDHALRRAGLPRLGASAQSAHRALLQVLPLAFSLAWNPPDPQALLDFLLLPASPLPRWAANMLARCVAETPGVGGAPWQETFQRIADRLVEKLPDEPEKKRSETLASWRAFVEPERYDPKVGMPRSTARALANRVSAWAAGRHGASGDELFLALATTASDFVAAIDATEAETLDRLLIERMIEQAIGDGVSDPNAVAEAAPWRVVSHPGAIWGEARTIVWWHFADAGDIGCAMVWDSHELDALRQAGCPLDDPALALRGIAASWDRPLKLVRDRIILVRPASAAGNEVKAHPLWHALVAGRRRVEATIGVRAEAILNSASPAFAGRNLKRERAAYLALPKPFAEWSATPGAIAAREHESASSLASLLGCPMKWTLNYASSLQGSARQSLAGGDALFGTLAHRIAEDLFKPGAPPDPDRTVALAREKLEDLLPEIAATLLLPGAARDLTAARVVIPEALGELARFLHVNALTVAATEQAFEQDAALGPNTGIRGAIDLLASDRAGRDIVIDLKWQRTDKYRRKEISDGVALQLAVYAKTIDPNSQDVATGYFMLRQKRFVTGTQDFDGPVIVVDGDSPKETWRRVHDGWRSIMDELASGRVRAQFDFQDVSQDKFDDSALMTPPKCSYCDFSAFCGEE